jgi:hypothetical protein
MAESKRIFVTGRMNKDLDERLVQNGEYRDAMNVEVVSSEGSNVGSLQNLLGNTEQKIKDEDNNEWDFSQGITGGDQAWLDFYDANVNQEGEVSMVTDDDANNVFTSVPKVFKHMKTVGAVRDTKENKIYYFITSNHHEDRIYLRPLEFSGGSSLLKAFPSMIIEYDANTNILAPVVVDLKGILNFKVLLDNKKYITGANIIDGILFFTDGFSEPKKINIETFKKGCNGFNNHTKFSPWIKKENLIKQGDLEVKSVILKSNAWKDQRVIKMFFGYNDLTDDFDLEDVTLIKPYPFKAPVLTMSRTSRGTPGEADPIGTGNQPAFTNFNFSQQVTDDSGDQFQLYQNGDEVTLTFNPLPTAWKEGDIIDLVATRKSNGRLLRHKVTVRIVETFNISERKLTVSIVAIDSKIPVGTNATLLWSAVLKEQEPLFKSRFARFAYRWKFTDGECSALSPFSEPAFLSGRYRFNASEGFNAGMINELRNLKITISDEWRRGSKGKDNKGKFTHLPDEAIYAELVMKYSDDTNIYSVAELRGKSKSFTFESEVFRGILPSSQLLRNYDVVPVFAKAQEIVGNRIVFGNYELGYDFIGTYGFSDKGSVAGDYDGDINDITNEDVPTNDPYASIQPRAKLLTRAKNEKQSFNANGSLKLFQLTNVYFSEFPDQPQEVSLLLDGEPLSKEDYPIQLNFDLDEPRVEFTQSAPPTGILTVIYNKIGIGDKSLKSQRTYQVGVSLIDSFGRKTPVISGPNASFNVPKENSKDINKIVVAHGQEDNITENSNFSYSPFTHYQHYVKECATEYHNLVMDSFYPAEDGNTWLAFPSSDRNKLQVGQYIELKKYHGSEKCVEQDAKYKVLDIDDDAPEAIRFKNVLKESNSSIETIGSSDALGGTRGTGFQVGSKEIFFVAPPNSDNDKFIQAIDGNSQVKFRNKEGTLASQYYDVKSFGPTGESQGSYLEYKLELQSPLDQLDIWTTSLGNGVRFTIEAWKKEERTDIEIEGKFYAKIQKDNIFDLAVTKNKMSDVGAYKTIITQNISQEITDPYNSDGTKKRLFSWRVDNADFDSDAEGVGYDHPTLGFNKFSYCITDFPWEINIDDRIFEEDNEYYEGAGDGLAEYVVNNFDNALMNKQHADRLLIQFENASGERSVPYLITGYDDTIVKGFNVGTTAFKTAQRGFFIEQLNGDPSYVDDFNYDNDVITKIHVIEPTIAVDDDNSNVKTKNPAVFETESVVKNDLDLFYEASDIKPILKEGFIVDFDPDTGYNTMLNSSGASAVPSQVGLQGKIVRINKNYALLQLNKGDFPADVDFVNQASNGKKGFLTFTNSFYMHGGGTDAQMPNFILPLIYTRQKQRAAIEVKIIGQGFYNSSGDLPDDWKGEISHPRNILLKFTGGGLTHGNHVLDWHNCYSFGNGVESNRTRDDFNNPILDKGPKASTVADTDNLEVVDDDFSTATSNPGGGGYYNKNGIPVEKYSVISADKKPYSLIYSDIYNNNSNSNKTNEFIIANKITKDLNPEYGSIQKLYTRDGDLVVLTEDKVINVLAYKDALYNADGQPQLIATNNVLGQAVPYSGEYGISKNPESFAYHDYRAYFTDKARGAVMRLSRDGLTEISAKGMGDYFSDNLNTSETLVGSYNEGKDEYIVTLDMKDGSAATLAYSEAASEGGGWTSFRSYIPEYGISLNDTYYTFKNARLWKHNSETRNTFYGNFTESSVNLIFNDESEVVKSFKTIAYEGTQQRKFRYDGTIDGVTYGINDKLSLARLIELEPSEAEIDTLSSTQYQNGWYLDSLTTDLQSGSIKEFIGKENKYFNHLRGDSETELNLDTSEFQVQGIGIPSAVQPGVAQSQSVVNVHIKNLDELGLNMTTPTGWTLVSEGKFKKNVTLNSNLNGTTITSTFSAKNLDEYPPATASIATESPASSIDLTSWTQAENNGDAVAVFTFESQVVDANGLSIEITLNAKVLSSKVTKIQETQYYVDGVNLAVPGALGEDFAQRVLPNATSGNPGKRVKINDTPIRIEAKPGFTLSNYSEGKFFRRYPIISKIEGEFDGRFELEYITKGSDYQYFSGNSDVRPNGTPDGFAFALVSVSVDIYYVFGESELTEDITIALDARAISLPAEIVAGDEKINGYAIQQELLTDEYINNETNIQPGGETRYLTVFGDAGATYGLTCGTANVLMAGSIDDIAADSRTIPTTGYDRIKIKFPAVTSRTTHTFTLTGSDLNSTLVPNVNPISIVQDGEVTLTVKPSITSYLGQTTYGTSGTPFTFDQNTSAPPGAAKVKFNSGSIGTYGAGSVTEIYIDKGTDSNFDTAINSKISANTDNNRPKCFILIEGPSDKDLVYKVTNIVDSTSHWTLTVDDRQHMRAVDWGLSGIYSTGNALDLKVIDGPPAFSVFEDDNLDGTFNTAANSTTAITRTFLSEKQPTDNTKFKNVAFKFKFQGDHQDVANWGAGGTPISGDHLLPTKKIDVVDSSVSTDITNLSNNMTEKINIHDFTNLSASARARNNSSLNGFNISLGRIQSTLTAADTIEVEGNLIVNQYGTANTTVELDFDRFLLGWLSGSQENDRMAFGSVFLNTIKAGTLSSISFTELDVEFSSNGGTNFTNNYNTNGHEGNWYYPFQIGHFSAENQANYVFRVKINMIGNFEGKQASDITLSYSNANGIALYDASASGGTGTLVTSTNPVFTGVGTANQAAHAYILFEASSFDTAQQYVPSITDPPYPTPYGLTITAN